MTTDSNSGVNEREKESFPAKKSLDQEKEEKGASLSSNEMTNPESIASVFSDIERDKREEESHANEIRLYELSVIGMRVKFAWAVFALVIAWLFSIIFIVVSSGINQLNIAFIISVSGVILCAVTGGGVSYCWRMHQAESIHKAWISDGNIDEKHEYNRKRKTAPFVTIKWTIVSALIGVVIFKFLFVQHLKYAFASKVFEIDTSVLIALITSTTASVLGILMAVMAWLFPRQREKRATANEEK